jgi:hypothetical protein
MISQWLSGALVLSASAMLAAQSPSPYSGAAGKIVSGTIKTAVALPAADGSVGVHLDLRTAEGMVDVHVAPATFIGQENFWFFADEQVVVTGFTLPGDDEGPIWAKAIKKGSTVLVLRREDGRPRWPAGNDGVDGCGVNHPPIQRTTLLSERSGGRQWLK